MIECLEANANILAVHRMKSLPAGCGPWPQRLERFPIKWNHLIEKESLKFKELEHAGIEKVEQLFRDMP